MKISAVPKNEPFVDRNGILAPNAVRWLQSVSDSPIREIIDDNDPPAAPSLKRGEIAILKATGISKTYIVLYDGTHHYYWETTGTDLY